MKPVLFEKKKLIEIVSMTDGMLTIQHEGESHDTWQLPRPAFDEMFIEQLKDYGWAIRKLKAGFKVRRAGWNALGQWVALMPPLYLDKDIINGRTKKHIGEGVDLDSQAYMVLWTAQGKWQPGWVASISDTLSEDWEVVE